jgi:hypothetical protein
MRFPDIDPHRNCLIGGGFLSARGHILAANFFCERSSHPGDFDSHGHFHDYVRNGRFDHH